MAKPHSCDYHDENSISSALFNFVKISEVLTGFSSFELYGTGQVSAYYNFVLDEAREELVELMDLVAYLPTDEGNCERFIREKILSDHDLGKLARCLIKLWYLGVWESGKEPIILSAESYKEGLVWLAIGAHPQGAKQQGFGSWSEPPENINYE